MSVVTQDSLELVHLVEFGRNEAVHGVFFKVFGGSPTFGVGVTHFLPYAYATSAGDRFTPTQMKIVALAPLFVVTSAAMAVGIVLPGLATYALLAIVVNVGGEIGAPGFTILFRYMNRRPPAVAQ